MSEEFFCVSLQVEIGRLSWRAIEEVRNVLKSDQDKVLCLWEHVNLQITVEAIEDVGAGDALVEYTSNARALGAVNSNFVKVHGEEILHGLVN